MKEKLNKAAAELMARQLRDWPMAARNYETLQSVRSRELVIAHHRILLQFNPGRITSTAAKLDKQTIAERPCFLCAHHLPPEQEKIDLGKYYLLVNPFPIFPHHFTLPSKLHQAQDILPVFADFLAFAAQLDEYMVFYNGPRCGASAPDHLHFQAAARGMLPLTVDYQLMKQERCALIDSLGDAQLYAYHNDLHRVYVIESGSSDDAELLFGRMYRKWQGESDDEPMMNILAQYDEGRWEVFLLPRRAFRPKQYTAEGDQQLLVSPAAVEMAHLVITPREEDFHKITVDDIHSIFEQIG